MTTEYWKRVKALIKMNKTTQHALSRECGMKERRIEWMTSRGQSPNVEESVAIARALGTTVEWLVTGEGGGGITAEERRVLDLYNATNDTVRAAVRMLLEQAPKGGAAAAASSASLPAESPA